MNLEINGSVSSTETMFDVSQPDSVRAGIPYEGSTRLSSGNGMRPTLFFFVSDAQPAASDANSCLRELVVEQNYTVPRLTRQRQRRQEGAPGPLEWVLRAGKSNHWPFRFRLLGNCFSRGRVELALDLARGRG